MNLFDAKISEDKFHASFKQISTDRVYAPVKDVIQSWGAGLLDRKGEQKKFINEFQSTFNSSMWELYLNKMFMDMSLLVDYSKSSPDFCITSKGEYEFNVEAVISDRSKTSGQKILEGNLKDHSTIKLAGKLKDKRDIFTGIKGNKFPYSSLDHVKEKPFVIAIAPFDSELALTQNNVIINRVLFGLEPPDETGRQNAIKSISKPSGAPVELGIFTNDSYKEISAVFFSTTGTFGKAVVESGIDRIVRATRYREISKDVLIHERRSETIGTKYIRIGPLNYMKSTRFDAGSIVFGSDVHIYHSRDHSETHVDGLQVYYNPYAENPFDHNVLSSKGVAHNFYDVGTNSHIAEHPDGALVSRQVFDVSSARFKWLLKLSGFFS